MTLPIVLFNTIQVKKIVFTAFILFLLAAPEFASAQRNMAVKKIKINGLKVFTEDKLAEKIPLLSKKRTAAPFRLIAREIEKFYKANGFTLVSVYLINESNTEINIYIDEGTIGKIIYKGLDDITLVRAKTIFTIISLEGRVFQQAAVQKKMNELKQQLKLGRMKLEIVQVPNYSSNFIQLDDIYKIPFVPDDITLPFFERYGYRYDLIITVTPRKPDEKSSANGGTLSFSLKLFYLGVTPKASYTVNSLFLEKDKAVTSLSAGVAYLADFNPSNPPAVGFIEGSFEYSFPPIMGGYFSPRTTVTSHYSRGSRPDIGLDRYDYIQNKLLFEPFFSFLNYFKVYPGIGLEKIYLFNTSVDSSKNMPDIPGQTNLYYRASIRAEIERYIFFLYPSFKRSATIEYAYYWNLTRFNRGEIALSADFSAYRLDILTLKAGAVMLWGDVPFYYDESVSGKQFHGFSGRGYYSDRMGKFGAEYRTSIHRGYLFAGPFADGVLFTPLDRSLHGIQAGVCGGGALHMILFDQFEVSAYLGRDFLFSNSASQFSISFSIEKQN